MISATIGNKHIGTIEYKHTKPNDKLKQLAKDIQAMANDPKCIEYISQYRNKSNNGRGCVKKAKSKG